MSETTTEQTTEQETDREEQQPETDKATTWDEAAYKTEIEKLRKEAASNRVKARDAETAANAKVQAALKALGIDTADEDPVEAAKAAKAAADAAKAEAANASRLLAVHKAASKAGANVDALLDSNSFTSSLNGLEPGDVEGITAAVTAALTAQPRFRTAPAAAQGGADLGAGGATQGRTYTTAQIADFKFWSENRADILLASKEGRIRQ